MAEGIEKISVYLCYILRHCPEEIGEPHKVMDRSGWVNVQTLINGVNAKGKYHITMAMLEKIVAEDHKGRYRFSSDQSKIKCCQGHSIEWVIPELEYKAPPEFLYHGTNTDALEKIMESGHISKMSRHAVHMQETRAKAWQSAERWHRTPVLLKIAALELYQKNEALGITESFGVTENHVWCAEDIPSEFIVDHIYNIG